LSGSSGGGPSVFDGNGARLCGARIRRLAFGSKRDSCTLLNREGAEIEELRVVIQRLSQPHVARVLKP